MRMERGWVVASVVFSVLLASWLILFRQAYAQATGPTITSLPQQIVAGDSFEITGSGFTPGSVVNLFVATGAAPVNYGPLTPINPGTTSLTVLVPSTISLGQGVVSVQVVNTDEDFATSNAPTTQLFGDPDDGYPNLMEINGMGLAATSAEPDYAVDNIETVVVPGVTVTLNGNGFDTVNGVAVDLFCACTGGKVGPFFLAPGDPGLTATSISFVIPATGPNAPSTGPGSFRISNMGSDGLYTYKSNAVSVPIGAPLSITNVADSGRTVTVSGTGFSPLTVLNVFNAQADGTVINFGGLNPDGSPNLPTSLASSTQLSFFLPAGMVPGPSYVQAVNPPFVPFTSSGDAPSGVFTAARCPAPNPTVTSLEPSSAIVGGPGFALSVNGTNFVPASVVLWNGNALPTTFVSSTQLQATIPASDVATIGASAISVANSPPSGNISNSSTFFTGTTGGTGFAAVTIPQQSNDLVSDPVHQVIYLSVPGVATANPNTIAVINEANAGISTSQFAGSNPNVLAISDDSSLLYAGIDGSASVQRFILPALTPDINYSLGTSSSSGPYYALDLQAAPGEPDTTAVTLGVSTSGKVAQGGIVIYDNSKPRPTFAPGFGSAGSTALYDSIQWGSDATQLFAANNEDIGFDFYTLSVNSSGVTLDDDYPSAFSSFNNRIHFDPGTGIVYSDDGHALNPATGLPVGNFSTTGIMVPDSTLNRAFFLTQTSSSSVVVIESFNLNEFSLIGSITIPSISGNPLRLVRWGSNGLAFNTNAGQVWLIGGNFVH